MLPRVDESRLRLAGEGTIDELSWAFYDCLIRLEPGSNALARRLDTASPDGRVGRVEDLIEPPDSPTSMSLLFVVADEDDGRGALVVSVDQSIHSVELDFVDGAVITIATKESQETSCRFAFYSVPPQSRRITIRLFTIRGAMTVEKAFSL